MNALNKSIMRIPWENNLSLRDRWLIIIFTFPFIGIIILLYAVLTMRNN